MIAEFVTAFDENRELLLKKFKAVHPQNYIDIVCEVASILPDVDIERITSIDHGDYQGTLVFILAEEGYQPSRHWAVRVGYGSCSGCDTLAAISESGCYGDSPTDEQANDYLTLALHIVQGLKEID